MPTIRTSDPDGAVALMPRHVDLVIRTSGEQRLSGFCPWQTAHAEVHVSPQLWPDFGEPDFDLALRHFSSAQARAGGDTCRPS